MTDLLSAGESAAHASRLSQASYIPFAPSRLSADMTGVLTKYDIATAEFDSQSSALNAAMAASSIGRRVFVPLASPQAIGEFYSASFQRLPLVAASLSHCLGVHTIRNDLNDILALRDSGWVIFLAENNQEMLDSIILSYRIAEQVLLPSVININGFALREPVAVPNEKKVSRFLKKAHHVKLDFKKPLAFNPPLEDYMEFKAQQQKAMANALSIAEKTFAKWKEKFNRSYGAAEVYMLDDADYAFVVAGFNSGTCRAVVDRLRAQGEKVGMLRLRMLRPFPHAAVAESMKNVKKAAVVDENISLGSAGILYTELAQHYHGFACGFVAGLGRYMTEQNFVDIFAHLKKADTTERVWV